jgi:hypothetical protein
MNMETPELVHKRKNDLYYIALLMYVAFGTVYVLITGTITNDTVEFGFRDPVVYIIGLFVVYTLAMLLYNLVRDQRIVLTSQRIVFRTRFKERSIFHDHILRIVLKRERRKLYGGTLAVVRLRIPGRRRWIRIRVANYERERELYQAFKQLKHELKK